MGRSRSGHVAMLWWQRYGGVATVWRWSVGVRSVFNPRITCSKNPPCKSILMYPAALLFASSSRRSPTNSEWSRDQVYPPGNIS